MTSSVPHSQMGRALCLSAVLLLEAGCLSMYSYVEPPRIAGDAKDWDLEPVCMSAPCSVMGWKLTNGDFQIDMMPRRERLGKPVFEIQTGVWSRNVDVGFSFDVSETYIAVGDGTWLRALATDYLRGPGFTGILQSGRAPWTDRKGAAIIRLGTILYLDAAPPPPGVPFTIRFAGLARDEKQIPVPDVEFVFRKPCRKILCSDSAKGLKNDLERKKAIGPD